jgi:hypothetical protein
MIAGGVALCTGAAIKVTCGSTTRQLVLSAAHCFTNDTDQSKGVLTRPWQFEFTNVTDKPQASLTKLWRSQRGDQSCLERYGDFAVAEFELVDTNVTLPDEAFATVAAKPVAPDATITVHGLRGQYADGGNQPDDINKIFEADVTVSSTDGYSITYSKRVLLGGDSGGRLSVSGDVVGVNASSDSTDSYGSIVTERAICALLAGPFRGACGMWRCTADPVSNPITIPTKT